MVLRLNGSDTVRLPSVTFQLRPVTVLIAASLLVAIAILIEGSAAKAFNGLGGILWIASALWLARDLRHEGWSWPILGLTALESLVLVLIAKPSNFVLATVGFAISGASIAWLAKVGALEWAELLPSMWLPMHLLVAVLRAVCRAITDGQATVRSDPPPTAALVPFAMVISALVGARLVLLVRGRMTEAARHAHVQVAEQ